MHWGTRHDTTTAVPSGWRILGAPLPGTVTEPVPPVPAPTVDVTGIHAHDAAFDAQRFTTWAAALHARGVAAWRTRDPEVLRPVMHGGLWDQWAQLLLSLARIPVIAKLVSSASSGASLAAASSGGGFDTVWVGYDVVTDAQLDALLAVEPEARRWREAWLFQRPSSLSTDPSGSVATCGECGAPVDSATSGTCPYCHADVSTRTGGWLVTCAATTMRTATSDRWAEAMRRMEAKLPPPPPLQPFTPPLQPPRAD